jgi:PAS domain S-box-containing protein
MRALRRLDDRFPPRIPWLIPLLSLATLFIFGPSAQGDGRAASRLVVVIYPDESDGAPGAILLNRAIRSTFASQSPVPIDIRNEYVDTSRLHDAEFMRTQVSLLRQKYNGRKVDLVIAGLSSGLDFAQNHRAELFPGAPIVYVAVDSREISSRALPPDVIGVPIRMELSKSLDLALRLHPDTRKVFVVSGSSPFDVEWGDEARRTFRPYEERLEFAYLIGLPMVDLLEQVARLPDQSIVYYLSINRDGAGKHFIPAEAVERIAARANAPIYSHVDTYVGRGIVGGHVFSFEAEGTNAARLGLRILGGEKPETIRGPYVSENADMFDWRQLKRWGINESDLPAGSLVRHKEPSFWDQYRWYIGGAALLFVIQTFLLAALLVQRAKRQRADRRFRAVIEANPTGMLVVGRDGKIVLANAQIEELFGYQKQALLGQYLEMLIPERFRGEHPSHREQFFDAPAIRRIGAGRDLFGCRKDGSEFPVEIGLSPIRMAEGPCVLASIIDITERKRSEDLLVSSKKELQSLAGKLLDAHESERRRIARELHDDLNQNLALLSVELELLGQQPPDSTARFAERVRVLSQRVRELSSSVHDLSHQIHPSKLEQLGLTAAVRGLCKELTHSHGLNIRFSESHVPPSLPEDTALCLYRIAQEALRNVIKHGRTDHAVVELSATSNLIRLRIADDGVGFDPVAVRENGGLGLVSMRERLHLIGGEIEIDSQPSGGTRIVTRVPLVVSVAANSPQQEAMS